MNEAQRFLERCKLTCFGGSEKGTCPCTHPNGCEEAASPLFSEYRFKAQDRMRRYLVNGLESKGSAE